MKDKILTALKTKFKTLGFGEKAFDGVADFLSKTVTEEKDIETAIGGVEPLLKAFQGDADKRVTTLKSELDELKKNPPKPTDPPKPPTTDPGKSDDIQKQISEAIKNAVGPLQQKLEGYEKRETQKSLQQKALHSIREGFASDKERKSFDAWMKGRSIEVEDESKLDEAVDSLKNGFTEFRQEMIDQGVITEIPKDSDSTGEKSTIDDYLTEKFGNNEN